MRHGSSEQLASTAQAGLCLHQACKGMTAIAKHFLRKVKPFMYMPCSAIHEGPEKRL